MKALFFILFYSLAFSMEKDLNNPFNQDTSHKRSRATFTEEKTQTSKEETGKKKYKKPRNNLDVIPAINEQHDQEELWRRKYIKFSSKPTSFFKENQQLNEEHKQAICERYLTPLTPDEETFNQYFEEMVKEDKITQDYLQEHYPTYVPDLTSLKGKKQYFLLMQEAHENKVILSLETLIEGFKNSIDQNNGMPYPLHFDLKGIKWLSSKALNAIKESCADLESYTPKSRNTYIPRTALKVEAINIDNFKNFIYFPPEFLELIATYDILVQDDYCSISYNERSEKYNPGVELELNKRLNFIPLCLQYLNVEELKFTSSENFPALPELLRFFPKVKTLFIRTLADLPAISPELKRVETISLWHQSFEMSEDEFSDEEETHLTTSPKPINIKNFYRIFKLLPKNGGQLKNLYINFGKAPISGTLVYLLKTLHREGVNVAVDFDELD